MHADIHLQLHRLQAAELHRETAASARAHAAPHPPAPTLRVQLGWKLVELGLRMATPANRPVTLAA
ncbi:hypothetical protein ACFWVF_22055 [Streptomyces sp. NPDC058659]|uniref:hypothetical protein n=1 Tax=unclassified Streptomyces TaxID=2593676 RepID=UPI00364E7311